MNACVVIEKGAIWRIGSGQMIDVWHHRWLPDLNHGKIISPNTNNDVSRVCDLFLPATRTWDPWRLANCFFTMGSGYGVQNLGLCGWGGGYFDLAFDC